MVIGRSIERGWDRIEKGGMIIGRYEIGRCIRGNIRRNRV